MREGGEGGEKRKVREGGEGGERREGEEGGEGGERRKVRREVREERGGR